MMDFESGISKLHKETDSLTINLTRLLIEMAGLVKKRHGKLSLTKKGSKILGDDHELLRLLLLTFATKFNWAYYDGYEEQVGQLGYGFSLILLSKYGADKRLESFYAERYFKAFPQLLHSLQPSYGTLMEYATRCYAVRTFERFLDYFGWITIEYEGKGMDRKTYIRLTKWFATSEQTTFQRLCRPACRSTDTQAGIKLVCCGKPLYRRYISKTDLMDCFIRCLPHRAGQ